MFWKWACSIFFSLALDRGPWLETHFCRTQFQAKRQSVTSVQLCITNWNNFSGSDTLTLIVLLMCDGQFCHHIGAMMTTSILSDSEKCRTMWLQLTLFLVVFFDKALGGCPFQNPFWFYDKPVVVNVFDENGEMVANKMRVMWGRLENFRCVDYFQVRNLILYVNPGQGHEGSW